MHVVTDVIVTISGDYLLSSGGYYFLSMSWSLFPEKMGKLRVATPKEERWVQEEQKILKAKVREYVIALNRREMTGAANGGRCPCCGQGVCNCPD